LRHIRNTLTKAVSIFDRCSIRYHLTGGITGVVYGEPRKAQDIDIVFDNAVIADRMEALLAALETSDFVFDEGTIRGAVQAGGMFQLFDLAEALKLDIYPRELVGGELGRSTELEIFDGLMLQVASRIDVALSKLIWIGKGSHESRRDLRQLHRASTQTDAPRIGELADDMVLAKLLREVLAESDELS
jgi:hypothetical protein